MLVSLIVVSYSNHETFPSYRIHPLWDANHVSGTVRCDTKSPEKSELFLYLLSNDVLSEILTSKGFGDTFSDMPQNPKIGCPQKGERPCRSEFYPSLTSKSKMPNRKPKNTNLPMVAAFICSLPQVAESSGASNTALVE